MQELFDKYSQAPKSEDVKAAVAEILNSCPDFYNVGNMKKIFGLLDLTTLNTVDTKEKVKQMCIKINEFHNIPRHIGMPNVAAVCVYPALVETAKDTLNAKYVNIAAVAGGFPASQTFLSIKIAEAVKAVECGANEIDMVIPLGKYLEGNTKAVYEEVSKIKQAIGNVHLKVILETGALENIDDVWKTSILAIEAGADFIKTSTGKQYAGASPEAVYVMTKAIAEYNKRTNKKVGIKPSGGISTSEDAIKYYAIVKHNLNNEWLMSNLFRIGASTLANNLLTDISKITTNKTATITYF